jgi:hypothetical protein
MAVGIDIRHPYERHRIRMLRRTARQSALFAHILAAAFAISERIRQTAGMRLKRRKACRSQEGHQRKHL